MTEQRTPPAVSAAPYLLILGYGNTLRRDDGAGCFLAQALARCWQARGLPVRLETGHQLVPEMALEIAAPAVAAVLFVDAAKGLSTWRLQPVCLESSMEGGGHTLSPAGLLAHARLFRNELPPAWLLTIPGRDFGHGEGLDSHTRLILRDVLEHALPLWQRIAGSTNGRLSLASQASGGVAFGGGME
ncbi:hypothetical protein FKZ61_016570 [Litorilinea aerophila]|uniref:Hydrogenase n=1 Tax=Litorilinea aerophila TaxID=1204385 RepID=A0A540VCM5_9CHLR|nr:hydrogenase [Litorilinea aerophila]MCC9077715.1 hypothetical protein [Litorilinea aerophila]